ncbi:MAG TPA: DsbA family oxidoreductase [Solirubrobacteraceae bacterium]|nr:DsbA family oxidoreductase [Solirubrobacteraceae bacterium]
MKETIARATAMRRTATMMYIRISMTLWYPTATADKPTLGPRYAECCCLSNLFDRSLVHVEIWSDIACPWCYVGKRRFEAALAIYEHRDEVSVTWRSFELDPDAPAKRPVDGATHLAEKYGMSREDAAAMQDRMTESAAGDGLDFRFDIARGANTFDAHRMIHLAAAHGAQDAMKERLMRAYLTEGELISDPTTLARLAREVGLPVDEVQAVLSTDRFASAVRDDERTAAQLGIHAVPFFVVDRAIGASGAHPPAQLLELLRHARAQNPPIPVSAAADSCTVDGSRC